MTIMQCLMANQEWYLGKVQAENSASFPEQLMLVKYDYCGGTQLH